MTQFIQLDKLTTRSATELAPFLFSNKAFLISERETVIDKADGHQFVATRVTLSGHPEYTFHTLVDQDDLGVALGYVDVTAGVNPSGSVCAGDPGVISFVNVDAVYPPLKLLRIANKVATDLVEYLCNPNELLYAEELSYQDIVTGLPAISLIITFTGTAPRRVLTKLTLAELSTLLEPIIL